MLLLYLKDLFLDPEFPEGTEAKKTWLARFYWRLIGLSKADRLIIWGIRALQIIITVLVLAKMTQIRGPIGVLFM